MSWDSQGWLWVQGSESSSSTGSSGKSLQEGCRAEDFSFGGFELLTLLGTGMFVVILCMWSWSFLSQGGCPLRKGFDVSAWTFCSPAGSWACSPPVSISPGSAGASCWTKPGRQCLRSSVGVTENAGRMADVLLKWDISLKNNDDTWLFLEALF